MGYECKILLDSQGSESRLTTFRVRYPRLIHSEVLTHRVFSRNSSSSRAIPIEKMTKDIQEDPFIPIYWGKNQSGMQAYEEMSPEEIEIEIADWLDDRDRAIEKAQGRVKRGLHKQIANRPLEAWMWITVVITSTEWSNFFNLRSPARPKDYSLDRGFNPAFPAQPEIQYIARLMQDRFTISRPVEREWHIPYLLPEDEEKGLLTKLNLSVARCARVSYLPHGNVIKDEAEDLKLCQRLFDNNHVSPLEHQARANTISIKGTYNLRGWIQYREMKDLGTLEAGTPTYRTLLGDKKGI